MRWLAPRIGSMPYLFGEPSTCFTNRWMMVSPKPPRWKSTSPTGLGAVERKGAVQRAPPGQIGSHSRGCCCSWYLCSEEALVWRGSHRTTLREKEEPPQWLEARETAGEAGRRRMATWRCCGASCKRFYATHTHRHTQAHTSAHKRSCITRAINIGSRFCALVNRMTCTGRSQPWSFYPPRRHHSARLLPSPSSTPSPLPSFHKPLSWSGTFRSPPSLFQLLLTLHAACPICAEGGRC